MERMEVTVEDGERHRVRTWALLTGVGLVVLGLISGLYAYESAKKGDVSMKKGIETAAADRMAVPPPIDAHGLTPVGNLFSSHGEREREAHTALPGEGATRAPLIDASRPATVETATFAMG